MLSSSRKLCRIGAFNSSKYEHVDLIAKPSSDDQNKPKKAKKRVRFALSSETVTCGFDDGEKTATENQETAHKNAGFGGDCEVKKGCQVVKVIMTKKEAALFISKCKEGGVINFHDVTPYKA